MAVEPEKKLNNVWDKIWVLDKFLKRTRIKLLQVFDKVFPDYKPLEEMSEEEEKDYKIKKRIARDNPGEPDWCYTGAMIILALWMAMLHTCAESETSSTNNEGNPDATQPVAPDSIYEKEVVPNLYGDPILVWPRDIQLSPEEKQYRELIDKIDMSKYFSISPRWNICIKRIEFDGAININNVVFYPYHERTSWLAYRISDDCVSIWVYRDGAPIKIQTLEINADKKEITTIADILEWSYNVKRDTTIIDQYPWWEPTIHFNADVKVDSEEQNNWNPNQEMIKSQQSESH